MGCLFFAVFDSKFHQPKESNFYCIFKSILKSDAIDTTDLQLLQALQTDASTHNQVLAHRLGLSPATSLRRVRRLAEQGLIERQVVVLHTDKVAALLGHGLTALVEITLDRQGQEHLDAFETLAVADASVQQCYRVSPGPDFILVVAVRDMPAYQALAQRLFTQHANVRNTKAYFSVKRAKFDPRVPLPLPTGSPTLG
jgi:DNA-binding Lrp family transcriptional regulator